MFFVLVLTCKYYVDYINIETLHYSLYLLPFIFMHSSVKMEKDCLQTAISLQAGLALIFRTFSLSSLTVGKRVWR